MKMLFFHGLTSSPAEVQSLKDYLVQASIEVVTPTLRGHETSVADLSSVQCKRWLEDVDGDFNALASSGSILLGGLSFGALMALYLACRNPDKIRGLILLSPPLVFRSKKGELLFEVLAKLPDSILTFLPSQIKHPRQAEEFVIERKAYKHHSLAAVARLIKIRRKVFAMKLPEKLPVFLGYAEDDHLLNPQKIISTFESTYHRSANVYHSYAQASHELLIGRKNQQVCADVLQFIKGL